MLCDRLESMFNLHGRAIYSDHSCSCLNGTCIGEVSYTAKHEAVRFRCLRRLRHCAMCCYCVILIVSASVTVLRATTMVFILPGSGWLGISMPLIHFKFKYDVSKSVLTIFWALIERAAKILLCGAIGQGESILGSHLVYTRPPISMSTDAAVGLQVPG